MGFFPPPPNFFHFTPSKISPGYALAYNDVSASSQLQLNQILTQATAYIEAGRGCLRIPFRIRRVRFPGAHGTSVRRICDLRIRVTRARRLQGRLSATVSILPRVRGVHRVCVSGLGANCASTRTHQTRAISIGRCGAAARVTRPIGIRVSPSIGGAVTPTQALEAIRSYCTLRVTRVHCIRLVSASFAQRICVATC